MTQFNEYLNKMNIDPMPTEVDLILSEKAFLGQVATLYKTHETAIRVVIENRIRKISEFMIRHCAPQEVIAYRLAIVELAGLIDDFEKYVAEYAKQKPPKEEPSNAPPVEEGKEGSL